MRRVMIEITCWVWLTLGGFLAISSTVNAGIGVGSFLALAGKDAVVIATDSRVTHPRMRSLALESQPRDIYRVGSKTLVGFFGLDNDAEGVMGLLRGKVGDLVDEELSPAAVARVLSNLLYENPSLVCPIIAGLDRKPFLCAMDSLGAMTTSDRFIVTGSSQNQLNTLCESFFVPDLPAEDLVYLAERCLRLAVQRDVMSGGDNLKIVLLRDGEIYQKDIVFKDI